MWIGSQGVRFCSWGLWGTKASSPPSSFWVKTRGEMYIHMYASQLVPCNTLWIFCDSLFQSASAVPVPICLRLVDVICFFFFFFLASLSFQFLFFFFLVAHGHFPCCQCFCVPSPALQCAPAIPSASSIPFRSTYLLLAWTCCTDCHSSSVLWDLWKTSLLVTTPSHHFSSGFESNPSTNYVQQIWCVFIII